VTPLTPKISIPADSSRRGNEGTRTAQETVFLFTHDKVASVAPPLLELKGFARSVAARPDGHGLIVAACRGFALSRNRLEPVFEPGEVEILVGPAPTDRAPGRDRQTLMVAPC